MCEQDNTPVCAEAIIFHEIDWRDPVDYAALFASDPVMAWLDSAATSDARGCYSYLAVDPFQVLVSDGAGVEIDGTPVTGDPFTALQTELKRWCITPGPMPVPFCGGAVGFFAYELARHLETVPQRHENDTGLPEMAVGFYDVIIAFDHRQRRAWILSSGLPAADADRPARARQRLAAMQARLAGAGNRVSEPPPAVAWRPEITASRYQKQVAAVLDYIRAGDIFQANFTSRFIAARPAKLAAFTVYTALRKASPAPFAAYLACGDSTAVASASPERFVQLNADGACETRPIKGTRRRGDSLAEDTALREELSASVKDRAENLMIVDLMRNDLGRVAVTGSVAVPSLCAVESFASVHHLVSAVTAQLKRGLGPVDLLRALFPPGSVTGAPKIRAMQIIDELECAPRGAYCGAIGWIGWDGAMDTSVAIRTVTITPDRLIAQAGGGIVADSDPADEYREMLTKIAPLLGALDDGSNR